MHSTLFNSDEGLVFAQPNRFYSAAVQLKSDFFILASSSIHPKLICILGDFMFKSNFRLKTEDIFLCLARFRKSKGFSLCESNHQKTTLNIVCV